MLNMYCYCVKSVVMQFVLLMNFEYRGLITFTFVLCELLPADRCDKEICLFSILCCNSAAVNETFA